VCESHLQKNAEQRKENSTHQIIIIGRRNLPLYEVQLKWVIADDVATAPEENVRADERGFAEDKHLAQATFVVQWGMVVIHRADNPEENHGQGHDDLQ